MWLTLSENQSFSSENDLNDDENENSSVLNIFENFVNSTKENSSSKDNWKTFEKLKKFKMLKISLNSEFALPLLLFILKNLFIFVSWQIF